MAKKRPVSSAPTTGKRQFHEAHPDQDVSLWRSLQSDLVRLYFKSIREAVEVTLKAKGYPTEPEALKQQLRSLDSMDQAPADVCMMSELFDDIRIVEYELERGCWEAAVARMYNVGWRAGNLGVADFVRIGKKVSEGGRRGGEKSRGTPDQVKTKHAVLQRYLDKLHEHNKHRSWTDLSKSAAKVHGISARHVRSVCSNPHKKSGK